MKKILSYKKIKYMSPIINSVSCGLFLISHSTLASFEEGMNAISSTPQSISSLNRLRMEDKQTFLDLSNMGIDESNILEVSTNLGDRIHKITEIHFNNNHIGQFGAQILAKMCAQYPQLERLSFQNCELDDESVRAFLSLTHLTYLDLRGNNISKEGAELLTQALTNLKRLQLAPIGKSPIDNSQELPLLAISSQESRVLPAVKLGPLKEAEASPSTFCKKFHGNPSQKQASISLRGHFHGNLNNLIYSDGNNIYLPETTEAQYAHLPQESYLSVECNQTQRVNFIPQADLPDEGLPEGFYELISIQDQSNGRIEKWQKLGEKKNVLIKVRQPGIGSIPGIGVQVQSVLPLETKTGEVASLQTKIKALLEKTQDAACHPDAKGAVIVIGPTGSGKTTLIHGLARKVINVKEDLVEEKRLYPEELLSGFNISHNFNVGTSLPRFWYDEEEHTIYWDCPGFDDPGGALEDITNAFAINHLFTHSPVPLKILLAMSEASFKDKRGDSFLALLNRIAEFFPDNRKLQQGLTFTLTQTRDIKNNTLNVRLKNLLEQERKLSLIGKELLEFFNNNVNRIFLMPYPEKLGPYPFNRSELLKIIESADYINDLAVKPAVSPDSQVLITQFAQHLNEYLIAYMQSEGAQRVLQYCRNLIYVYYGSMEELRMNIRELAEVLKALAYIKDNNPITFVDHLQKIINVKEIREAVEQLRFLKTIQNNISYSVADWANALNGHTLNKINNLIKEPQTEYVNGGLYMKGLLIGTSDVLTILRATPNITSLNLFSLNMLLVDEDLKLPSITCQWIAPSWKMISPRRVDLSGEGGATGNNGTFPGENGHPGKPGSHGGHFYGKGHHFTLGHKLTVQVSGGNGGNGGHGANGANGIDGKDGDLNKVTSTDGTKNYVLNERDVHEVNNYYEDQGTDGTPGGAGGRAGAGGASGKSGAAFIEGINSHAWMKRDQAGQNGENGQPGTGGIGGRHGKHCEGHYSNSYWKPRSAGWQRNHDGWNKEKKHLPRDPSHAPDGPTPSITDLNREGQLLPQEIPSLNYSSIVQEYKTYYFQEAVNPNVGPFIKVFPNL